MIRPPLEADLIRLGRAMRRAVLVVLFLMILATGVGIYLAVRWLRPSRSPAVSPLLFGTESPDEPACSRRN